MAVTLTAAEAATVGLETTDPDIALAATIIDNLTGYTVDQHETARLIPVAAIQRAWAIVAARLTATSTGAADPAIVAQTDDAASYTLRTDTVAGPDLWQRDPLYGLPRLLLNLPVGTWHHV